MSRKVYPPPSVKTSAAGIPYTVTQLRIGIDDIVIREYDQQQYQIVDIDDKYITVKFSPRSTLKYTYEDFEENFYLSRTKEEISAAYHAEKESLSTMNKALFKKGDRVRRKDAHNLIHTIVSDPDVEGRVHTIYEDNKDRLLNGLVYINHGEWELVPTYPTGWQNIYDDERGGLISGTWPTRSEADEMARKFRIAVKEHCADGSTILHTDV